MKKTFLNAAIALASLFPMVATAQTTDTGTIKDKVTNVVDNAVDKTKEGGQKAINAIKKEGREIGRDGKRAGQKLERNIDKAGKKAGKTIKRGECKAKELDKRCCRNADAQAAKCDSSQCSKATRGRICKDANGHHAQKRKGDRKFHKGHRHHNFTTDSAKIAKS